jgi:hypothetical protein
MAEVKCSFSGSLSQENVKVIIDCQLIHSSTGPKCNENKNTSPLNPLSLKDPLQVKPTVTEDSTKSKC